jgi:hypothetical protein
VPIEHADCVSVDDLELVAGQRVLAGVVGLVLDGFNSIADDVPEQLRVGVREGAGGFVGLILLLQLFLLVVDGQFEADLCGRGYFGEGNEKVGGLNFRERGEGGVEVLEEVGVVGVRLVQLVGGLERGDD